MRGARQPAKVGRWQPSARHDHASVTKARRAIDHARIANPFAALVCFKRCSRLLEAQGRRIQGFYLILAARRQTRAPPECAGEAALQYMLDRKLRPQPDALRLLEAVSPRLRNGPRSPPLLGLRLSLGACGLRWRRHRALLFRHGALPAEDLRSPSRPRRACAGPRRSRPRPRLRRRSSARIAAAGSRDHRRRCGRRRERALNFLRGRWRRKS
mmetsp:Transcript_79600/g.231066  ORF Transcript_79600/g.231066 Transcript_79600/m.231066 type:complete len:213 (-) Transcript_79600:40-678(-)